MRHGGAGASLLLTLLAVPVGAQTTGALVAADTTLDRLATERRPGIGITVVQDGAVRYQRVIGMADLALDRPARVHTPFPWASVEKQFTAFGVARLVVAGKVDPDAPLHRYLPEAIALGGDALTVRQLIHHTSGIEDLNGLLVLAGHRPGDPATLAEAADLLLGLEHLRFAPGNVHAYSNGGYTLLARLIEVVTGEPLADWMSREVYGAVGMTDAMLVDGRPLEQAAQEYRRDGDGWSRLVRTSIPGAGGGFRGSISDMAAWMQHLLHPTVAERATALLRTRGVLTNGDTLSYAWGLDWGDYRGTSTLSHSGGSEGISSVVMLLPEHDLGVAIVVLGGGNEPNIRAISDAIIDQLLGDRLEPVTPPAPRADGAFFLSSEAILEVPDETLGVRVDPDSLVGVPGRYGFDRGFTMVVRSRPGGLEFAFEGQPPWIPLHPLADGRWMMMPIRDAYRFVRDGSGRVTGVIRDRGPGSLRPPDAPEVEGARLPDAVLDEAQLASWLGWYYSSEVDTWYEVTHRDGHLVLRHPRLGSFTLTEIEPNHYTIDSYLISGVRFTPPGSAPAGMELEAYSWGVRSTFTRQVAAP